MPHWKNRHTSRFMSQCVSSFHTCLMARWPGAHIPSGANIFFLEKRPGLPAWPSPKSYQEMFLGVETTFMIITISPTECQMILKNKELAPYTQYTLWQENGSFVCIFFTTAFSYYTVYVSFNVYTFHFLLWVPIITCVCISHAMSINWLHYGNNVIHGCSIKFKCWVTW